MSDVERKRDALRAEVERLRAAIREHRANTWDEPLEVVDERLWEVLDDAPAVLVWRCSDCDGEWDTPRPPHHDERCIGVLERVSPNGPRVPPAQPDAPPPVDEPRAFVAVMQHPDLDRPPVAVAVVTLDDHREVVANLLAGRTANERADADQSPAATPGGQPDAPPPDARGPWTQEWRCVTFGGGSGIVPSNYSRQAWTTKSIAESKMSATPRRTPVFIESRYVSAPVRVTEDGEQG